MGFFDDLFGTGGAGHAASSQINQGIAAAKAGEQHAESAFGPYWNSREAIFNQYRNALSQGADPEHLLNQYMAAYQQSPALQAQISAGTHAANAAASASGMLGSTAEQGAVASNAERLRSQDVNNYINRLMGIRSQYLGGLGGLEHQGVAMSGQVSNLRERLAQQQLQAREQEAQAAAAARAGRTSGWQQALGTGLGIAASAAHII